MKRILGFLKYVLYFVIGNIIFNLIFSATKTIVINEIGAHERFSDNLSSSFGDTVIIYSVVFLIILISNYIYNIYITKSLNEKLEDIRKRSDKNEE